MADGILDFGSIDFTPDWAKKSAGVSVGKVHAPRESGYDRKPFGNRSDRRGPGEGGKPFVKKPFAKKPFRPAERPRPLEVEVKILPETKALGTIIRKLQGDTHAYKLKDLAYFFLDNPQSVLLKITPTPTPTSPTPTLPAFHQCKVCGFVALNEGEVIEHVLTAHLGDYYDAAEIECEPPKGNFNCVAKCGLSGVLLGPPNIHEFNATVKEMIRTRYPDMSEEQYRAHIEMVRDNEVIEQWRAGATRKTVFTAKGAEAAPQLTREQAEGEFRRTILASLITVPKQLMITADAALKSPVKPLVWAVRDALEAERRAPYAMCFALRGAFHHRKLKFFRANDSRGPEFVTNVEYKEFDAEHAIPELAKLAKFIVANPCCDRSELPADAEVEKHLNWLVTTGHVVAFTNGVYSMVEKFPKYGPQWKKRAAAKPEPEPVAEPEPAVESAPVAEPEPVVEAKLEAQKEIKDETAPVVAE